jgi:Protein of unknown function (DUF2752)
MSPRVRWVAAIFALLLASILVTARVLEPDPRGFGTHEQLGLQPCSFWRYFGRPCPTCGATTAWAWTLRGELPAALASNIAATLLCIATLPTALWLAASTVQGRWLLVTPTLLGFFATASVWLTVALADWIRRVWL